MKRRDFLKTSIVLPALSLAAGSEIEPLRLIHVTDSHMDLSMPHTVEALEHFVQVINQRYPNIDCVLFGGDNFNNTAPGDSDARRFKEILDQLRVPYYCVRGNKESSPKPDSQIDQAGFAKLFFGPDMLTHGRDWMVHKKGYIILGLDSTIEHSGAGRYTKETIRFAKKMLDLGKPTIILNHHPYLNYWGGTDPKDIQKYVIQNAKKIERELFGYPNLLLTLSGHKHIDNVSKIGHVTAISTRAFKAAQIKNKNPMRYIQISGTRIEERLVTT